MKKYVVKPGDTLYNISQKTGVRMPLLLASNPQIQNPSQLMPGMSIVIPELGKKAKGTSVPTTKTTAKTAKAPSAAGSASHQPMSPYFGFVWPHQIAPSDTWDKIAQKYGVSIEQLHHLNPDLADVQTLKPGRIVYVPTPAYPIPAGHPGQTGGAAPYPTAPPMQTPVSDYGAHTHNPYRPAPPLSAQTGYAAGQPGWYVIDESSSFLSEDDDADIGENPVNPSVHPSFKHSKRNQSSHSEDMRGDPISLPDTDDEGWSKTLTVRIDDEK